MQRITLAESVPIAVVARLEGRTGWGPQDSGEDPNNGAGTGWCDGYGAGSGMGHGWAQAGGWGGLGLDTSPGFEPIYE